jgi:hypothetical protein
LKPAPIPITRAQRVILAAALVTAGVLGIAIGYWVWRAVLGIPLQLPEAGVTLDTVPSRIRPWAPPWVLPALMVPVSMLLWRLLAQRHGRISLLGAAATGCLIHTLVFPLAHIAIMLGTIVRYDPPLSLVQLLWLVPQVLAGTIPFTVINLIFHGIVALPAGAVLALGLAAVVRVALWITKPKPMLPAAA